MSLWNSSDIPILKTRRLYKHTMDMCTAHSEEKKFHHDDSKFLICTYLARFNTDVHADLSVRVTFGFENAGIYISKYARFRMKGCRNGEARRCGLFDVCNGIDRIGEEDSV